MSSLSSQYFNAVLKIMAKKGAIKEYTTKEYINAKVSKYPMILEDFHIEFNDGTVVRAYKISSTATANNTYETLTERPDSKFIEYHTYKEVAYVVQYIQALAKRETSVENPPKNCTHITQEEASELGRLLRGVRTGVKNEP